jgi:phenylacetate-coenzyme A ligase PaaK-like adenylate-forming protein
MELLLEEQQAGRLDIHPAIIITSGEYLTPQVRQNLEQGFGCTVQTNYFCTEGGTIACECPEQHLHINDDWIILEAVDENNRPVPAGTQSAKVLLTNLSNYVQPCIRYEITDRIIMHEERCSCGKTSPWIELEGRTDDFLIFPASDAPKKILPQSLYHLFKEIQGIRRFQVIQRSMDSLELRLSADNKEEVFREATAALSDWLQKNDIFIHIFFSGEDPIPHPGSGKVRHVYQEFR